MNTQKTQICNVLAVVFLRRVQLIFFFLHFSFLSTVIYIFHWSHFPIFKYIFLDGIMKSCIRPILNI